MIESSVLAIFGPLLPLIVELIKSMFPTLNPRYISVGVCALIALGLGVSLVWFGQERVELALQSAMATTGLVYAAGTGLYKITGSSNKLPL